MQIWPGFESLVFGVLVIRMVFLQSHKSAASLLSEYIHIYIYMYVFIHLLFICFLFYIGLLSPPWRHTRQVAHLPRLHPLLHQGVDRRQHPGDFDGAKSSW